MNGHDSPFPDGTLILRPGEHKEITFPRGSSHGFGFDRKYPVTVTGSPSTPTSTAFDVVVHSKGNEPPSNP